MKPYAVLFALLLAAGLLLDVAGARAQRFPRQLENIKMFGKGESVEFIFSQPYEGTPAVDAQKGSFSLNFSGTGSTKPVRSLRPVEESIYKEIRVVENRYSTTVTFQLKDPALNLKDKLGFKADKNVLRVSVNAPNSGPPISPQGKATEDLLREMETRIAGETGDGTSPAAAGARADDKAKSGPVIGTAGAAVAGAAAQPAAPAGRLALGDVGGTEFFYSLATMVIALVIIVGGLYGVLLLYNRFLAVRLRRFTGSHSIRQVAAFHIGPRQRIVVLDINDELIACGVTPTQITYLTHLGGKGPVGRAPGSGEGGLPKTEPGSGAKALAALVPEAHPPVPADPVHQFAEVLKQKVRSLKRIN